MRVKKHAVAPRSGTGLYPFARQLKPRPSPLRLVLLGATGSIGTQTVDVVRAHPDKLKIVGLSCHARIDALGEILAELETFQPEITPLVAVTDPASRDRFAAEGRRSCRLLAGDGKVLTELVREADAHCLVNALVGAVGLEPTLAGAKLGLRIALANKETLVMGGDLVASAVAAGGAEVLPVDSEHAAIAQCLTGRPAHELRRLILTASGGPFRTLSVEELASVTLDQVLDHPTWKMGPKITVDSATLMNKGLEVIEAHHLFGIPYDLIDVVVHPGSIVHSLVEFVDGAVLAQLGTPDMRIPLQYAVSGQAHWPLETGRLDLIHGPDLHFEEPDTARFPCLDLARSAGLAGGASPVVLNAANEVAVAALLDGRIGFTDIGPVVADSLERGPQGTAPDLESVLAVDRLARDLAADIIAGRTR